MTNAKGVLNWMEWKKREKKLKENMTNKEYIRTCSTEELADVLARYVCGWTTNHSSYEMALHSFSEWLKQPHNSPK